MNEKEEKKLFGSFDPSNGNRMEKLEYSLDSEAKETGKLTELVPRNSSIPPLITEEAHDAGDVSAYEIERDKKAEAEAKKLFEKKTEDDEKYIIRDKTSGATYDIRTEGSTKLQEEGGRLTTFDSKKSNPHWEEWWAFKKERSSQLLLASEKGDTDKARELLDVSKHGDLIADVNTKGLDDYTPLHISVSEGNSDIVLLLIENKAAIDPLTTSLRTPLHIACYRGKKNIIEMLVNANSNVNAQEIGGNTPTHILSEGGWRDSLDWLLDKGPDLSIRNSFGETAMDVAANLSIKEIFAKHAKEGSVEGSGYSRTVVDNLILHNGRADVVKKMMFAQHMLTAQTQSAPAKKETGKEETKKVEAPLKETKRRRIQIIETVKRISAEKRSELAKEPGKGNGEEGETVVGPDDFEAIHLLGKGSFGEVFMVKYKATGKLYAMKVLSKKRIMSQNLFKYALAERNVLCFSKHPFIVGIDFAFQTADKLFLILEFCPGGDLGKMLQKEKKFPEEKARIYASEILLGLEDLHRRDIIFRDLKPENVVIDEEGHAMLTDFGLSKEGVRDDSLAKSFCGSIAYMAPEILKRSGHGKSLDWYLLGLLIYEMLVGIPPYYSTNKDQLFKNIQSAPLRIPFTLSVEAKSLIIGLLNRNPAKRLGSGKTDAEELKKHPWFSSIDWDLAYKRGLKPPKPLPKAIPATHISSDVFAETEKIEKRIPNWTFVGK